MPWAASLNAAFPLPASPRMTTAMPSSIASSGTTITPASNVSATWRLSKHSTIPRDHTLPRGRTENVAPHAFTYSIVKEPIGLSDCLEAKEDRPLFAALGQGVALVSLYLPSPSKPRGSARHKAHGLDYARPARERVTPGRARIAGPWA